MTNSIEASRLPRKILLVHGALTIVLPYVHTRLRGHALSKAWPDAPSSDRRRKAWELMTKLETAHAAIALASFVAFLWDGRWASRISAATTIPAAARGAKEGCHSN